MDDDQIDYRALYQEEVRRRLDTERRLQQEEEARKKAEQARKDAERDRDDAERDRDDAERSRDDAEKQLAKTTFLEFLHICHYNIFLKLDVEKNQLLSTTGGLTRVDGKLYPRHLKPWPDFAARHAASFAALEQAFRQRPPLFPSPAGLGYLADKLSDKKLAGEEDLKNFECLAVEGCALDVLPHLLELVHSGVATVPGADPPTAVSFNNYPYGVVATESDEAPSDAEPDQDATSPAQRSPSRGRARSRRAPSVRSYQKPLVIKQDRPAYIGALGVAKRDMDAAIERAAAAADERDRSGPPRKRPSPERTKVFPDQWCFRHGADGTMRPLFVVEYKAAHKIDNDFLRTCLEPGAAASLMEDTIRALSNKSTEQDGDVVARRDIAKVVTQAFHYMVDYGLQYSYATTGHALVFFYLDPAQPATLYYRLEEPKRSVRSADRDDVMHSAVALVLAFVLMAMTGEHMTHRWKKMLQKDQPRWPTPYDGMDAAADTAPRLDPAVASARLKKNATAGDCGDPQKRDTNRRRDQDDEDDGSPGPSSKPGGTAQASPSRLPTTATRTASTAQSSLGASASGGSASMQGARQEPASSPVWSLPVNAPLSPALPYCTQACLRGLKTGGAKDPHCPNASLHQRRDATGAAGTANDEDDGRHPISAEELRTLLVQQLADDMDHDCQSLERFGMYGAIGALFKLALSAYGYCFVGKGVQRAHRKRLAQEAALYDVLAACQGRLVPVNLGVIELVDEYWTECGAHIAHMMLMAFAGDSLWHHGRKTDNPRLYHDEMLRTLRELAPYGVVHDDVNNNNMVWNEELQRVMAIDLDHAHVNAAAVHVTGQPAGRAEPEQEQEQEQEPASSRLKRRDMPNQQASPPQAKRAKVDLVEAKENAPYEEPRRDGS